MGVVVGTAAFGAPPRFLAQTLENTALSTKRCKIGGAPKNGRSNHHPSRPSVDALLPCGDRVLQIITYKNKSEIMTFGRITNLTRNSLKMSVFPGHVESTRYLNNYEK